MSERRLDGRRAVVVHVGSDLGATCAATFASHGAEVLVVDPSQQVADDVCAAIVAAGGVCHAQRAEFGSQADIVGVATRCESLWGALDVLTVCAGAFDWWPADEDTMENWERLIRVNLLTPAFYTKALRHLLARSGSASVVYYGSIDGIRGNPRLPVYSASRGALVPYTHVMAHTLGPEGIRVNLIAGGSISPLGPEAPPRRGPTSNVGESLQATPLGRRARPEDVAGIALFLASGDSAFVTGTVVTMDGGRTAITPGCDLRLEE